MHYWQITVLFYTIGKISVQIGTYHVYYVFLLYIEYTSVSRGGISQSMIRGVITPPPPFARKLLQMHKIWQLHVKKKTILFPLEYT